MLPTRHGFIGESLRPMFRDVRRIDYESVDELAANLGVDDDDAGDGQRVLIDMDNRVGTLAERLTRFEIHHSNLETDLKKTVEKQNTAIEGVNSTMELHSETLRALFCHIRVLESAAFNKQPSASGLTDCRYLNATRFCIAEGIMTAFPGLYSHELIKDRHDPLGKTVHWRSFKSAMSAHFWRLHDLVTLVDRNSRPRAFEVIQKESVFADCYAKRLYMIGPLAHSPIAQNEHALAAVIASRFCARVLETFPARATEDGQMVEVDMKYGPYNEKVMKLMFNFVIPALVWTYTELKKHIIRGDSIIRVLEKRNAKQRYLLDHPDELVPIQAPRSENGESEVRFAHGTALDVRREEYWREYTDQLGVADMEEGRKLYNYWLEDEDVYAAIEREEEIQAVADRVAWEAAFPCTAVARAFVPPDNGIKHMSSTRMISTLVGRKRSNSEVDGFQSGESPSKARKATGSCPTPSRVRDEEEEALNVNNAARALSEDETKLETVRKRRRIHVARFTSVYKCLSILLDPDLVEFAILGDALIRKTVVNHYNSLERGPELMEDYRRSTDGETTAKYPTELFTKLHDLLGKGDEELRCFDDPNVTVPMEVALDKHLRDKARVSSASKTLDDIHLIMSYLGDVRPAKSD